MWLRPPTALQGCFTAAIPFYIVVRTKNPGPCAKINASEYKTQLPFRLAYDTSKILQAIQDAGLPVGYWQNILIQCNPDESITALKVCDGLCGNGGDGNNDYCTN
ncbi:hypothetical protein E4U32_005797 [Claviceps aff. humidiphila group G2b]|nr:hypothetical protein E4U32_005797 [Claviceps aff. humidiphila group G2b]